MIYSHSIRTAGNSMDEAIVNYVRFKHHLLIGSASAEAVKKEQGSALAKTNGERVTIHMKGRDLQRGFPTEIELEPHDIAEALSLPIQQIVGEFAKRLPTCRRSWSPIFPTPASTSPEAGRCSNGSTCGSLKKPG